jgi:hypothetical protein
LFASNENAAMIAGDLHFGVSAGDEPLDPRPAKPLAPSR